MNMIWHRISIVLIAPNNFFYFLTRCFMFKIELISAIFLLIVLNSTCLFGQIGTTKPTKFTWEGALDGNKAIWKVNDTSNVYQNLDGVDITIKLIDPEKINTNTQNPSEYNDFTKSNTFYSRGNLAFQITSRNKTQTACLEFSFSKPIFLNDFQVWDIDMLQSGTSHASSYQDSVSFFAKSKAGNIPLALNDMDAKPTFTIMQQSAKADFYEGINGDITHNNPAGAIKISSSLPIETFTLCYSNGSEDDGMSNSHAIKITEFSFTELIGGISGTVINKANGLPIAGSIIKLVDDQGNIIENKHGWAMHTMTDETGQYHFDHLPMGNYKIVQINPPGFESVEDTDGINDNIIQTELTVKNIFSKNNDFFELQQGPLPVKLESFSVSQSNNQIISTWNVSAEQNCSHYELHLFDKDNQWIQSQLTPFDNEKRGNYESLISYNGSENKIYVKLLQYDLDGTMTNLGIKGVYLDSKKSDIVFYPNPTKSTVFLKSALESELISTIVFDVNGKVKFQTNEYPKSIDMSEWNAGTYFIQCTTANESTTQKIIKD